MEWETELKEALENNKAVIGTNETLKELTSSNISKVFVASNTLETTIARLNAYKTITQFDLEILPIDNQQLGEFCKKQFNISVIGIKK